MDYNILQTLCNIPSPSGREQDAVNYVESVLPKADTIYKDKIGNRAFYYGSGPVKILLSAHIDEVCARVTYISDDGILSIISTGGICKKSLIASHVQILSDNGTLFNGIVEKTPIHCEEGADKDEVEEIHEFKVNFGDKKICGCAMDDKAGIFICLRIIQQLVHYKSTWDKKYTVIFLAATQEETGLRGAKVAASAINPDISIDFDVTFACNNGRGVKREKYGNIKLGEGGVIQFGPDKSERLNSILIDAAEHNDIKYQRGVSRAGGTNTSAIQLAAADCETTLISIPNKDMHTPVELVSKDDIESIISLVSLVIEKNLL